MTAAEKLVGARRVIARLKGEGLGWEDIVVHLRRRKYRVNPLLVRALVLR